MSSSVKGKMYYDKVPAILSVMYTMGSAVKQAAKILHGSYSQSGQDAWVIEMLNGKQGGYFVELGAGRPQWGNNTWLLERQYAWGGICIEPNSTLFRKLCARRTCTCIQRCVDAKEGSVRFLECGIYSGLIEGYSTEHRLNLQRHAGVSDEKCVIGSSAISEMQAVPLATVLDQHNAPSTIDYLSLDTEGSEYRILSTFPFDRYVFRTITIEHYGIQEIKKLQSDLLRKHGYVCSRECPYDDFYCHPAYV